MRDNLLNMGVIAAATKTTEVFSADILDFGTIDSRFTKSLHQTGEQPSLQACFSIPSALAAGDYINNFKLVQCATSGGSYTDLITGKACAAASPKGIVCKIPMPLEHQRFIKAGCTPQSSGTFTAIDVEVWLEPAPGA